MLNSTTKLYESIRNIKGFINADGNTLYKELIDNFNNHLRKLDTILNPKEEWYQNEEFFYAINLWAQAISHEDKPINEAKKLAAISEVKKLTNNDIVKATEVFISAAKSGSIRFTESIKHITPTKVTKTSPTTKDVSKNSFKPEDIEKQFNIKILDFNENTISISGTIQPYECAKIGNITGKKIIIIKE